MKNLNNTNLFLLRGILLPIIALFAMLLGQFIPGIRAVTCSTSPRTG